MGRHLRRWLNEKSLRELGGQYEGRIASVTEEQLRNKYTAQRQLQPVIAFEDGWLLVPNLTQRMALVEVLGTETDHWIGEGLTVFLHSTERTSKKTGRPIPSIEKRVCLTRPEEVAARRLMQAEEQHLSVSLSES